MLDECTTLDELGKRIHQELRDYDDQMSRIIFSAENPEVLGVLGHLHMGGLVRFSRLALAYEQVRAAQEDSDG